MTWQWIGSWPWGALLMLSVQPSAAQQDQEPSWAGASELDFIAEELESTGTFSALEPLLPLPPWSLSVRAVASRAGRNSEESANHFRQGGKFGFFASLAIPLERASRHAPTADLGAPQTSEVGSPPPALNCLDNAGCGTTSSRHDGLHDRSAPDSLAARHPVQALPDDELPFSLRIIFAAFQRLDQAGAYHSLKRRYRGLVRRSRRSGWVPELRLRGVLGFDRATSQQDINSLYPGEVNTRGARDSLLEARLLFRLDRLVLGAQEPSLQRILSQLEKEREERRRDCAQALIDWISARRSASDPQNIPQETARWESEAQRALAEAYLLTDGWFLGEATLRKLGIGIPWEKTQPSTQDPASDPETYPEPIEPSTTSTPAVPGAPLPEAKLQGDQRQVPAGLLQGSLPPKQLSW